MESQLCKNIVQVVMMPSTYIILVSGALTGRDAMNDKEPSSVRLH